MDEQKYNADIQRAVVEVDASTQASSGVLILKNGIKLKLKKIQLMRIQAVWNKFPYPKVPAVWDEDRQREIKNPNSEEYLQMKADVDEQRNTAIFDAIAALGVDVLEVPEGIDKIEDDNWIEECEVIGLTVDKTKRVARKLAWMKYVALSDPEDMINLSKEFGISMGLNEEQIATAVDSFRSH